jgi:hypothetical protein
MKKATKIEFQMEIEGQGLVNYNGNNPHKRFSREMIVKGAEANNGKFAKENIYKEEIILPDGTKEIKEVYKKIISSNLLRKHILGCENDVNADKLVQNEILRISYLSQDTAIARGYCVLGEKNTDQITVKRSTGVSIVDAEQISNTSTWLETKTQEGKRDKNSLFYQETCGKIEYKTDIFFDIKQLQFISIDDNYDRCAIAERDVNKYIEKIEQRYGKNSAKFGNWATTHNNFIGEQGIVLSGKVVTNVIREIVKRMLDLNIKRAGAYAKTKSLKLALGYAGDKINLNSKKEFFSFNSIEEYDALVKDIEFSIDFMPIDIPTIEKKEKEVK